MFNDSLAVLAMEAKGMAPMGKMIFMRKLIMMQLPATLLAILLVTVIAPDAVPMIIARFRLPENNQ